MFRLFTRMRALRAPQMWAKMSDIQRMNYALAEPMPVTLPEVAYYRGMGFKSLGNEYLSDAIHSFKSALDLGFENRSEIDLQLSLCYRLLEGDSCNRYEHVRGTDGNYLSTQCKLSAAL